MKIKIEGIITALILITMLVFVGGNMFFNLVDGIDDIILKIGGLFFITMAVFMMVNFKDISLEITANEFIK